MKVTIYFCSCLILGSKFGELLDVLLDRYLYPVNFFPGSCKALMDTHPCQRHDLEPRCEQMPQSSLFSGMVERKTDMVLKVNKPNFNCSFIMGEEL